MRESISLTGQFAAVDEVLTGRENLILVAQLRHLANAGTIADELLERFSLTDAATRAASTYSGGMRRRLDIAMSLIGGPPSSSSTSRLQAWTPKGASTCGRSSRTSQARARRCC